jgi:hypothetical protein
MPQIAMRILAVMFFIAYNHPSYSVAVAFSRRGESTGAPSKINLKPEF